MNFAVQLPTPDGRHAGLGLSARRAWQPASFQADPPNEHIPACEDDAQPEGGMGRGLPGRARGESQRVGLHTIAPSARVHRSR